MGSAREVLQKVRVSLGKIEQAKSNPQQLQAMLDEAKREVEQLQAQADKDTDE